MHTSEPFALAARIVAAVLSFSGAMACAIASTVTQQRMVTEVNAHLPEQARFDPFWWHAGKFQRLLREYARLCPTGPCIRQMQWRSAGAFIGMAVFVLAIVPGRFGVIGALWFTVVGFVVIWLQMWVGVRQG